MPYTITIQELLERPILHNRYADEWMNKLTDEELNQWDKEVYAKLIEDGTPNKFPDLNAGHLSAVIDRTILYKIFKESLI